MTECERLLIRVSRLCVEGKALLRQGRRDAALSLFAEMQATFLEAMATRPLPCSPMAQAAEWAALDRRRMQGEALTAGDEERRKILGTALAARNRKRWQELTPAAVRDALSRPRRARRVGR